MIAGVDVVVRDQSGCERVCPWTRHLHHSDHPKVCGDYLMCQYL